MKRNSSNCLRVSISFFSRARPATPPKTNHERTLYVLFVFRNLLISREEVEGPLERARKLKDRNAAPGGGRGRVRLANDEAIGVCEGRHHGRILDLDWRGDDASLDDLT